MRRDGTRNLVAAARAAGARRLICQSIAFAYAPAAEPVIMDEAAPLNLGAPPPFGDAVRVIDAMERAVLDAGLEGLVLRYGWFYGPGTFYADDGHTASEVRRRRFPIVGSGAGLFSFVHVDDAAAATVAAVERGAPGIYNVVDDEPAAMRDWLPAYAEAIGARPPRRVPVWLARLVAGKAVARRDRPAGRRERQGQARARLAAALGVVARGLPRGAALAVLADGHQEEGAAGEDEKDAGGHQPAHLGDVAERAQQHPRRDQHERRGEQRAQVVGTRVSSGLGDPAGTRKYPSGRMSGEFETIEEARQGLGDAGYLADESTALVSFLAGRLGKPVLVEGPAGVGKTELAKAISRATERKLIRLQCYEGLDEAKALYEWNYRKQLLRIQTEAREAGWQDVQEDIFGEDFLLARPLLNAISAEEPVVLLIDEIDKTDQEFEAMLLEVLSDFQISIPELGVVEARTQPLVLLTSNNSRELTEALKRRCLYLWLDYPSVERELEIVHLHAPELDEAIARKLVEVIHMVRALDLKKPPSIAESIDWARALLLLGADDIDQDVLKSTMSIIVKHRTDLDLVAERVGVKLGDGGILGAQRAG